MLSRVANRIYWMARYLERAENTARLVNVNTILLLDLPRSVTLGWRPLISITTNKVTFSRLFSKFDERNVVRFLIADPRNSGSLLSSLQAARENARTIRDVIPREGWEAVNSLYLRTKAQLPAGLSRHVRHDFLNDVIHRSQGITGLLAGTMLNDSGYHFLRLGRNLERSDMTTRIVDVRSENLQPEDPNTRLPFENIQWMSVLQSLSAYQGYKQRMQGQVRREEVVQFLLQDVDFPRAFAHCMREVNRCLQHLPHNKPLIKACTDLSRTIRKAPVEDMRKAELEKFIDHLQLELGNLHQQITDTYFPIPQQKARKRKSK
jgi:uncharacterized alpha-E superfamily protein